MDAFRKYIGCNIKHLLERRRVVVFYDPREAFRSFIEALPRSNGDPLPK